MAMALVWFRECFFVTLISISQKNEFQTMTYQYVIQYFSRILPTAPSKSWWIHHLFDATFSGDATSGNIAMEHHHVS